MVMFQPQATLLFVNTDVNKAHQQRTSTDQVSSTPELFKPVIYPSSTDIYTQDTHPVSCLRKASRAKVVVAHILCFLLFYKRQLLQDKLYLFPPFSFLPFFDPFGREPFLVFFLLFTRHHHQTASNHTKAHLSHGQTRSI